MNNQPALSPQTIAAIKACAVSIEDMGKGIATLAKITNQPMTTKDIRDIAAYWGSPCINAWVNMRGLPDPRVVNAAVLESLEAKASPDLKVCLRPISSLTDEEVFSIADIAIAHGGTVDRLMCEINRYESNEWEPIVFGNYHLRTDGSSYHSPYWISKYGLFGCGDGDDGNEVRTYEEAAVIAYLQSIHAYVPGTIDPKYVQLTT